MIDVQKVKFGQHCIFSALLEHNYDISILKTLKGPIVKKHV